MNKDKVIAELFVAPEEGTLKVLGIDGYFITRPMIEFLETSEDEELYLSDLKKAIYEKYGDDHAYYTVTCELDYIEKELQGEFNEHELSAYYTFGEIIDIQKESFEGE